MNLTWGSRSGFEEDGIVVDGMLFVADFSSFSEDPGKVSAVFGGAFRSDVVLAEDAVLAVVGLLFSNTSADACFVSARIESKKKSAWL